MNFNAGVVRAGLGLVGLAVAVVVAGCGTYAPAYPPQGIDELTIPMPIDPDDFVDELDNPWLSLTPGRQTWSGTAQDESVWVRPDEYAGVATLRVGDHQLAQDADGNVWRLADDQAWLVISATPRFGDSYRSGPDELSEVVGMEEPVTIGGTRFDDAAQIVVTSQTATSVHTYVKGVGEVMVENPTGTTAIRILGP